MSQLTIYLDNTNKVQFCKWLSVYCKKMQVENATYPYMGEQIYNLYYPYDIAPDFQSQLGLDATFYRSFYEDENRGMSEYWTMEDAIKVSWLEVGTQLKLTIVRHEGRWIMPPIVDLLYEIGGDWKGTQREINQYMQQQADKYGIKLEQQLFPENEQEARAIEAADANKIVLAGSVRKSDLDEVSASRSGVPRKTTVAKKERILKEYRAMKKRNEKEFRRASRSEEVKKLNVVAQDIFDRVGAELGIGKRRIQQYLQQLRREGKI